MSSATNENNIIINKADKTTIEVKFSEKEVFTYNFKSIDKIVKTELAEIPNLDGLADLNISGLDNDHVIKYDNDNNKWVNEAFSTFLVNYVDGNQIIISGGKISLNQVQIDHDELLNFSQDEHRIINDNGTSEIELWSASKISTELALKASSTHIHTESDISDLDKYSQSIIDTKLVSKADVGHSHIESDISDLDKYTQAEINSLLSNKSNTNHTHIEANITDLDKYTQSEVDALLANKANFLHNHNDIYYTETELANGILNDLYYTESEVDTLLAVKADSSHNHDDLYYRDTEVDELFNIHLSTYDHTDLHKHSNKSLLDTYLQTEEDLKNAVDKAHIQGTDEGTESNSFYLGDGTTDENKTLFADITVLSQKPAIRYNITTNKWQYSNDGIIFLDIGSGSGGNSIWGEITGTLSDQTDLQVALDAKAAFSHTHTESDILDLDKYTQSEVDTLLNTKAAISHEHDDRYYTETELDILLDLKLNSADLTSALGSININALADITSSGANIEDAVNKKHSQNTDTLLQAEIEYESLSQTTYDNNDIINNIRGIYRGGQDFIANKTGTLDSIQFRINKIDDGSIDDLIIEIYNAGANHFPTGGILESVTIAKNTISDGYSNVTATFSISITAGNRYVFIVRQANDSGDSSNEYQLIGDNTVNSYLNGTAIYSLNGGSNWNIYTNDDAYFVVTITGDTGYQTVDVIDDRTVKYNILVDDGITIDGRDLSVDGIKLDTIETGAEVNTVETASQPIEISSENIILNYDTNEFELDGNNLSLKDDSIKDYHIDWGTGANQVSATDLPIVDSGSIITATEVETALQEIKLLENYANSPMVITGGDISQGTNAGTFKVDALTALLRTTDSEIGALAYVTLAEQDNQTITAADITYFIVLNYNGGNPTISLSTTNPYNVDKRNIPIGKVMKDSSDNIHYISGGFSFQDGVKKLHQRASLLRVHELVSGSVIAYSGTNNFTMTAGIAYAGINRITLNSYDSAVTQFIPLYRDGIGGWIEGTASNTIDYAHYDDGSGTLANISNNKYGCFWIYKHMDDNDVYVIYGRDSYTLAEAEVAGEPSHPDHLINFGLLIGKIIVPQSGGSFADIQMVTDTFFIGTSVSNHNELGSLQGGIVNEYYHLTNSEYTELSAWLDDVTLSDGGALTIGGNLTIGDGAIGIDYSITFDGETNDGIFTWMENEDYFAFSDDILLNTDEKIYFRDTALYVSSLDDGHLDLTADVSIDLNANVVIGTNSLTINSIEIIGSDGEVNKSAIEDSGNWDAAYVHISNDGSDHSFINQDVTTTSSPTFVSITLENGETISNADDGSILLSGNLDLNNNNINNVGTIGTGIYTLTIDETKSLSDFLEDISNESIGNLSDVNISTLSAGELLIYDATNGYFKNAELTGGNGIDITNGDSSITIAVNSGLDDIAELTPTDGNFIVGDGINWVTESGATVLASLGLDSNLTDLTSSEIQQLENIDATTISSAQWGYLGAMSSQPLESVTLNDITDVNNSTPADKHVIIYDGITDNRYENRALVEADISDLGSYLENIVEDTTPQLGGNLDINGNLIQDANGNELLDFSITASAVNYLKLVNAATENDVELQTLGDDSNIGLELVPKGNGKIGINNAYKFPNLDGNANEVLITDGSGNLSFSDLMNSYTNTFVDGDLTAGVLTISHNLGTKNTIVSVYDNSDNVIVPDEITATDINTTTIDLSSYGTLTGTWRYVIIASTSSIVSASIQSLIRDADEDTKIDVEASTDLDEIVMTVAGTEAMRIHDNGIIDMPLQPKASAYMNNDQTIASGVDTTIQLNTENFDIGSNFDVTTYTYTIPLTGYYQMSAHAVIDSTIDGGAYVLYLKVNTAIVRRSILVPGGTGGADLAINDILYLTVNDTVLLSIYQATGSNQTLKSGIDDTYLTIHKLS